MTDLGLTAIAAGGALAVSLALTPMARSLAIRLSVLDHPDEERPYKLQARPVPYLGGFAILLAAVVAYLSTGVWRAVGTLAFAVLLLTVLGLMDDLRGGMGVVPKVIVPGLAAAIVIFGGIQASVTGFAVADWAITLVWLVAVTNAVNVIDNANGITAGTLFVASSSFSILAMTQGQHLIGPLAGAIAGATLGFLPYNFPRARIFMGDAGTLPLGFLVATVALKIDTSIPPPWSFAVPLCILSLPLLNMLLVVIHRLTVGLPIYVGGLDSIWHRVVLMGLSKSLAVLVLLGAAAAVAAVGVLTGIGLVVPAVSLVSLLLVTGASLLLLRVPLVPAEAWKETEDIHPPPGSQPDHPQFTLGGA